jgi:hypothetical protein
VRSELAIAAAAAALGALASAPAWADPAPPPTLAPAATPAASGVISYPVAFFAAVRPNTALDMINNLPGFSLDTGGAVRGFGGAAGNVLIDGERPATKNDPLDEILKRIPASAVARIDLIRGGAPGIDMQGKTLIANVIRKNDQGLKLVAAVQYTAIGNGRTDYGLRFEGSRRIGQTALEGALLFGTGADDGTGNGPHLVTTPSGAVLLSSEQRSWADGGVNKAAAAVETPFLGGRVRIEGSFIHNPYFFVNADVAADPAAQESEVYKNHQDTAEVGVRYDRRIGGAALEAYALQQLGWYDSADDLRAAGEPSTFTLAKHTGESILRATATLNPAPALQLEAGVEGDYNWLTSATRETLLGLDVPVPAANVHVVELRGEAFADATWRMNPKLSFEAGARIEASQLSSSGDVTSRQVFVFPKPRFVATWTPVDGRQLQLRVEREVSQLDFADFAASGTLGNGTHAGNPTLTPPQDWVAEASFDQHLWEGADASLSLRHMWLSDVIDQAPECAPGGALPGGACGPLFEVSGPANIGDGAHDEASLAVTLPTDKLMLKHGVLTVRATWRHSQVTDPATYRQREISNLRPVDAEAHYTQGLPGLRSTWGIDYYAAWRQTTYYFSEVDTQHLGLWLEVYFEWKPTPDWSLKVEADNLTGHGLEYQRDIYDPFRDVAGGTLAEVDTRRPHFAQELTVRLRKTFG